MTDCNTSRRGDEIARDDGNMTAKLTFHRRATGMAPELLHRNTNDNCRALRKAAARERG